MKSFLAGLWLLGSLAFGQAAISPPTTIDPTYHYGYGANVGWMDWRGDVANGAVIGDYVCSGFTYAANSGWINLGSGMPTNGIRYQNLSAFDFGVNHDGMGRLRGLAWSANAGWISFEDTGAPSVDLMSGLLSGYAYGANVGWITLSSATALLQTDSIFAGMDLDGNGLPDAWEILHFGHTGVDPGDDPDLDGVPNKLEYLADTDPNDGNDSLRINEYTRDATMYTILGWNARPTRYYYVQRNTVRDSLSFPWSDWLTYAEPGWNRTGFFDTDTNAFYRVRAYRPLTP